MTCQPFDWTPLKLQVLLHHYVSPQHYVPDSDAAGEARRALVDAKLLTIRKGTLDYWEPTPRGRAHVEALLRVQPPRHEEKWVTDWPSSPPPADWNKFEPIVGAPADAVWSNFGVVESARRAEFDRSLDGSD